MQSEVKRLLCFYLLTQRRHSTGFTRDTFGFCGPKLSAILDLYSAPSAQVYTSSPLSKPFHITNGTYQSCPLSPLIFNLIIKPLAESFHSHPSIHDILLAGRSHSMNLFADNVILMLTKPDISLLHTHAKLSEFSLLSYYKVKYSKSLILKVGIPGHKYLQLQQQFPYNWTTTSIPYLGVFLTPSTASIAGANYKFLIPKLDKELNNLATVELSWAGRLAASKMLILPQILYLFRTLYILTLQTYLSALSSLLKKMYLAEQETKMPSLYSH